jgi:hypothetical protein
MTTPEYDEERGLSVIGKLYHRPIIQIPEPELFPLLINSTKV